jgi:hypothetical protein
MIRKLYIKELTVLQHPSKANIGLLSTLTNMPSTIVSTGSKPIENSALISILSKSTKQNRSLADGTNDASTVNEQTRRLRTVKILGCRFTKK